eukprot:3056528-Rhodomonas_salina.3
MDERFTVNPENIPAEEDVDPSLRTDAKKILGTMLFPAGWSRPDESYQTVRLTRYAAKPWPEVMDHAKCILKFLVKTKHDGIRYSRNVNDGSMLDSGSEGRHDDEAPGVSQVREQLRRSDVRLSRGTRRLGFSTTVASEPEEE